MRGLGDDAAAGRDHGAVVAFQHRLERAPFIAAIGRLAVEIENLAQRRAGDALDLAVEFDEWHAELLRQHRAERRFAGAAQPDQRDPLAALMRDLAAEHRAERAARLAEFRAGSRRAQRLDQQRQFDRPFRLVAHQFLERTDSSRCAIWRSSRMEILPCPVSSWAR